MSKQNKMLQSWYLQRKNISSSLSEITRNAMRYVKYVIIRQSGRLIAPLPPFGNWTEGPNTRFPRDPCWNLGLPEGKGQRWWNLQEVGPRTRRWGTGALWSESVISWGGCCKIRPPDSSAYLAQSRSSSLSWCFQGFSPETEQMGLPGLELSKDMK